MACHAECLRCNTGNDKSKCIKCSNLLYLSGDTEGNCVNKS